jgi:hypothetical protein
MRLLDPEFKGRAPEPDAYLAAGARLLVDLQGLAGRNPVLEQQQGALE